MFVPGVLATNSEANWYVRSDEDAADIGEVEKLKNYYFFNFI